MSAAFVAFGEALVDAIAVGLIGDDENAGLGRRGGGVKEECTGKERRKESHDAPIEQETALIR